MYSIFAQGSIEINQLFITATGEFLGTFFLLLLGNGVVANAILKKTKGSQNKNWFMISAGWFLAVVVGIFISYAIGQSNSRNANPEIADLALAKSTFFLNPVFVIKGIMDGISAATAGLNQFDQILNGVPIFDGFILIGAEIAGAMLGAWFVYLFYYDHYKITEDSKIKLATFCTAPEIRRKITNFFSESVGTFVLVAGVIGVSVFLQRNNNINIPTSPNASIVINGILPFLVGLVVYSVGISLGGTTGYAINPARDLGPRLTHQLIFRTKNSSDWKYAWIPIVGPIVGGIIAVIIMPGLLYNQPFI